MGRAVEKRRGRQEIRGGEELEEEFRALVRERSAIVVVSDNVDSIFLVCLFIWLVDWRKGKQKQRQAIFRNSMSSFWGSRKSKARKKR